MTTDRSVYIFSYSFLLEYWDKMLHFTYSIVIVRNPSVDNAQWNVDYNKSKVIILQPKFANENLLKRMFIEQALMLTNLNAKYTRVL